MKKERARCEAGRKGPGCRKAARPFVRSAQKEGRKFYQPYRLRKTERKRLEGMPVDSKKQAVRRAKKKNKDEKQYKNPCSFAIDNKEKPLLLCGFSGAPKNDDLPCAECIGWRKESRFFMQNRSQAERICKTLRKTPLTAKNKQKNQQSALWKKQVNRRTD